MNRWDNPQQIAERALALVRAGKVRTPGEFVVLISVIQSLPPRLRSWAWQQLEREIGWASVSYLREWQSGGIRA